MGGTQLLFVGRPENLGGPKERKGDHHVFMHGESINITISNHGLLPGE